MPTATMANDGQRRGCDGQSWARQQPFDPAGESGADASQVRTAFPPRVRSRSAVASAGGIAWCADICSIHVDGGDQVVAPRRRPDQLGLEGVALGRAHAAVEIGGELQRVGGRTMIGRLGDVFAGVVVDDGAQPP